MTDDLLAKIERLEAQVAALTNERLPTVDRASRRRDRRQVLGGFGMFAIALLMAGTLSASALAGSNTVFTDDIAPKQVYGSDIADNAVSGSKVYPNSITGSDVNESTLSMRGNCTSPGLIQGNVTILGTSGAAIPTTYQENYAIFKYNCSGGRVFVKRQGPGYYYAKFEGNLHVGALVSVNSSLSNSFFVKASADAPGEFRIIANAEEFGVSDDVDVDLVVW